MSAWRLQLRLPTQTDSFLGISQFTLINQSREQRAANLLKHYTLHVCDHILVFCVCSLQHVAVDPGPCESCLPSVYGLIYSVVVSARKLQ